MARSVGELMVRVRQNFAEPLTDLALFEWHRTLLEKAKRINIPVSYIF